VKNNPNIAPTRAQATGIWAFSASNFNPTTVIKYQLPEDGFVVLQVFDILGRVVATLVNQQHVAGYCAATFGGHDVSGGVYFARLVVTGAAGEVKYSKMTKLVLMK